MGLEKTGTYKVTGHWGRAEDNGCVTTAPRHPLKEHFQKIALDWKLIGQPHVHYFLWRKHAHPECITPKACVVSKLRRKKGWCGFRTNIRPRSCRVFSRLQICLPWIQHWELRKDGIERRTHTEVLVYVSEKIRTFEVSCYWGLFVPAIKLRIFYPFEESL